MPDSFLDTLRQLYNPDNKEPTPEQIEDIIDKEESGELQKEILNHYIKQKASAPVTWGTTPPPAAPPIDPAVKPKLGQSFETAGLDTIKNPRFEDELHNRKAQSAKNAEKYAPLPVQLPGRTNLPVERNPFAENANIPYTPQEKELTEEEQRQKIIDDMEPDTGDRIRAGLAAFGSGLRGGDPTAAGKAIYDMKKDKGKISLEAFDKKVNSTRQSKLDELKIKSDQRAEDRENRLLDSSLKSNARAEAKSKAELDQIAENKDPNSNKSKSYRDFFLSVFKGDPNDPNSPKIDPTLIEGKSFNDLEKILPTLASKWESDARIAETRASRAQSQANFGSTHTLAVQGQQNQEAERARAQAERERVEASQLPKINQIRSYLADLKRLRQLAKEDVLGQIDNRTGTINPNVETFNNLYTDLSAVKRKELFGAVTSADLKLSQDAFPDPKSLNSESFTQPLDAIIANTESAYQRTLDELERNGTNVSKIRELDTQPNKPPAKPPEAPKQPTNKKPAFRIKVNKPPGSKASYQGVPGIVNDEGYLVPQ